MDDFNPDDVHMEFKHYVAMGAGFMFVLAFIYYVGPLILTLIWYLLLAYVSFKAWRYVRNAYRKWRNPNASAHQSSTSLETFIRQTAEKKVAEEPQGFIDKLVFNVKMRVLKFVMKRAIAGMHEMNNLMTMCTEQVQSSSVLRETIGNLMDVNAITDIVEDEAKCSDMGYLAECYMKVAVQGDRKGGVVTLFFKGAEQETLELYLKRFNGNTNDAPGLEICGMMFEQSGTESGKPIDIPVDRSLFSKASKEDESQASQEGSTTVRSDRSDDSKVVDVEFVEVKEDEDKDKDEKKKNTKK